MEFKKRYKLYKQGKRWCVLALSFGNSGIMQER